MIFKTYYLAFNTPLHLGNHKPDSFEQSEDLIRSDTLTAAVFSAWAKMGHAEWIPEKGTPPFVVSSAFPYIEKTKGNYIHFFPRPRIKFNHEVASIEDSLVRKKIKKVQWLDQHYFEAVINNDAVSEFGEANEVLRGKYLCKDLEPGDYISKDLLQRVTIPRNVVETKDSEPFFMERIFFDRAGLFFLAEGEDLEKLEKALEFLQSEGFGTDRNVGNGFFDLKKGEIEIRTCDDHSLCTNLSLYTPKSKHIFKEEISHPDVSFETVKRGGWITTPGYMSYEKKSVHMFCEGGIWKKKDLLSGVSNIDLSPAKIDIDHKIWRSGRSIFIPVKN